MKKSNKIISFLDEKKGYILSFFVPLALLTIVFILLSIVFGDYNALSSDLKSQYYPLMTYLKDVLSGDASAIYSFNNGMGGSMISTIAYYLISPFNLLVAFFSKTDIANLMLVIIILKISLSGFTMYTFLKNSFKKAKWHQLLIFSSCYALMGFNIAYYMNVIWLDAVYLLPLMIMGINSIINGKSPLLYGTSLFLAILCNFYMGYMLCIFSFMYFIYKLFLQYNFKKDKAKIIKATINYGVTSLLAGLMTFALMVPMLISMLNTSKLFENVFLEGSTIRNGLLLFSKIFIGSQSQANLLGINSLLIYSGIIVIPLVLLYFLNKKICLKEKMFSFGMILIFLVSSFWNYAYYAWHAFAKPVGFEYRFSFIFVFFLIFLAVKSYLELENVAKKKFLLLVPIIPIYGIVMLFVKTKVNLEPINIIITIILYLLYIGILYFIRVSKDKKIVVKIKKLLVFLVIAELFLNTYMYLDDLHFAKKEEINDGFTIIEKEISNLENDEFFRIDKSFSITNIDPLLFDYNGVSVFLSTASQNQTSFLNVMGVNPYKNISSYSSNFTPVLDSVLGIKYILINDLSQKHYKEIKNFEYSLLGGYAYNIYKSDIKIYENPYALSLGYMTAPNILAFEQLVEYDKDIAMLPIHYQNELLKALGGYSDDVFIELPIEKTGELSYEFTVQNNNITYLQFDYEATTSSDITIYINGYKFETYDNIQSLNNVLIEMQNNWNIGDKISIDFKIEGEYNSLKPSLSYFDNEVFAKYIEVLKKGNMEMLEFKDGYIKAKVNVTKERPILFTTVPYEYGWSAKIDNETAKIYPVVNTFNALILEPGEHIIEFSYQVPGLNVGVVISLVSSLLFVLYNIFYKKISNFFTNSYLKFEEIILYLIVGVLTTVINVAAYAMLTKVLSINYMVSTVIAWVIAVTFAYIANKILVFKSKTNTKKQLLKEAYEFYKFRILSLVIEVVLMYAMVSLLSINDILSKIVINVIVIVANYVFSKLFIFKKA